MTFTLQVYWQFNNGNIPTKRTCWNNNLLIRSSCPSLLQEKTNSSEIEVLQFQALMTESHHSISWDHFFLHRTELFLHWNNPENILFPGQFLMCWTVDWSETQPRFLLVLFLSLSVQSWRLMLQRCTVPSLTVPTAVSRKCAPVLLCAKHQTCTRCLHCQMRKHLFIVCISVALLWYVSM